MEECVSALAKTDEARGAVVQMNDGSALQRILDAARDPAVDVDKYERLMAMYERTEARFMAQQFAVAMSDAQAEMRIVSQDAANPQTRSRYASYAALDKAMRPIYTRHGFSLSFNTAEGAPDLHVRVVCQVKHRDGASETHHIDIPADGKGAKGNDVMTKTHATMSAVTYGRRALLKMIFNIAEGKDIDDDGNGAGDRDDGELCSDAEAQAIVSLAEEIGAPLDRVLGYVGALTAKDMTKAQAAKARHALGQRKSQRAAS
jgi:hypothetical protein